MLLNGFGRFLPVFSCVSLLVLSFPAHSDSSCKGLEESACKGNASCTWVSGYTTKNGNTVSAYCRKAGGQSKQSHNSMEEDGMQSGADIRTLSGVLIKAITLEENSG
jgi:hypothetical protein